MADKERIQMLQRLGRETVIKYGTYDVTSVRKIDSDHIGEEVADAVEEVGEENAEDLAAAILQSNFRTGMSQAEVDELLKGL